MKRFQFLLPLVLASLPALAGDLKMASTDLALCTRNIIDANTSLVALSLAANFLEESQYVKNDSVKVQNINDRCNVEAKSLGKNLTYTREQQMQALSGISASHLTKKILSEFISPTTYCYQLGAEAMGAIGGALSFARNVMECHSSSGLDWIEPVTVNLSTGFGLGGYGGLVCRLEVRKGHRGNIPFVSTSTGRIRTLDTVGETIEGTTHMLFVTGAEGEDCDAGNIDCADNLGMDANTGISGLGVGAIGANLHHHAELGLRVPMSSSRTRLFQLMTTGEGLDKYYLSQCPAIGNTVSFVKTLYNAWKTEADSEVEGIDTWVASWKAWTKTKAGQSGAAQK